MWASFPEKMQKSSSLGFKGFSGNIEVSNPNQARGRRRPRTRTEIFSTKITNVALLGPMDVYTNVIHQKRMPQLKAKFTACNLVCTEAMPMTKFAPRLDSYESLGVNVGKTHRNEQGSRYLLQLWPTVSVLHKFLDTKKETTSLLTWIPQGMLLKGLRKEGQ